MANQLGSPLVTPRFYARHMRHARFGLIRHAKQVKAFLAHYSTLSGTPSSPPETASQQIFEKLTSNTAARVKAASTYGSLS